MPTKKKTRTRRIKKPEPLTSRERATLSKILAKARAAKAYKSGS